MNGTRRTETIDTLVIGGGQAGLSVGHHLKKRGVRFLIVDGSDRIGDAWRNRWDSLRLFTPARFSSLDGMPFPSDPDYFPTKDEMADYLEAYAARFELPVRGGQRVRRLTREHGRFVALTDDVRYEADQVVIAMCDYQRPRAPRLAKDLDPSIRQLHSADYRNPGQLRDGPVVLVGAGNSGADIAMELVSERRVWLAGPDVGHIPFRIERTFGQRIGVPFVLRVMFHRLLTVRTPMGRSMRAKKLHAGVPLVRIKPKDLERAGVERVPRVVGTENGLPVLEDGRVLDVPNVVWCTGFHAGFDWIDLPVHGEHEPLHESGVVPTQPGLFFVGLGFLHAVSSSMIHGVAATPPGSPRSSRSGAASPALLSGMAKNGTARHDDLIEALRDRFEQNISRHRAIPWSEVESRLEAEPEKLSALAEMERTGGEPDVVGQDKKTGEIFYVDCSPESPDGRRSLCYDREALDSRKKNKPEGNAVETAAAWGATLLTEEDYRSLQKLGEFDAKTSSWLKTPPEIRELGGAIFGDRRFGRVFIYHNGAESYYAARGFRCVLRV